MAMNLGAGGGQEPEVMVDINTTPLIDVMLVLLIMLIITIPIQTHAVKLNMPVGAPPPDVPPQVVTIEVDFDGTMVWNGEVLHDRADLEAHLRGARSEEHTSELQSPCNLVCRLLLEKKKNKLSLFTHTC